MKWHVESATARSVRLVATMLVVAAAANLAACSGLYSKFGIAPLQWELGYKPPETQASLLQPQLPDPRQAKANSKKTRNVLKDYGP